MPHETTIDPRWSVNETIARHPETMPVFNRFGVDTCCGGGAPITDAARRDGADADALLAALGEALRQAAAHA